MIALYSRPALGARRPVWGGPRKGWIVEAPDRGPPRRRRPPVGKRSQQRLKPGPLGREVEAEVARGIGLKATKGPREGLERACAVSSAEVVESDTYLDQPLEEIARGSPEARPHRLKSLVALEVEAAVELRHAPGQGEPLLAGQFRLGGGRHHPRIRRVRFVSA